MVLSAILQGPLGVDRCDFVFRDTRFSGLEHFGFMEIDRIIGNSTIYTKPDGTEVLSYNEKVISDAIQGLTTRIYMYRTVYLHKTVIAAAILIEAALHAASGYLNLVERTKDLDRFVYLNDSVLDQIINSDSPELEEAQYYAKRVYIRDLPKLLSEEIIHLTPDNNIEHLPRININKDKNRITWVGRILSNDFCKEFTKYDIHVNTVEGVVPFKDYWNSKYSHYPIETYYIKRVYIL